MNVALAARAAVILSHKENRTMRTLLALAVLAAVPVVALSDDKEKTKVSEVLNYKMKGIDGKEIELYKYQGKVILFVNVASRCGYTKQYTELQAVYEKYNKDGFVVIGVPANEFGKQEPGTD